MATGTKRRTGQDYVNAMKHAVGLVGQDPETGVDLWHTFNDAGRAHMESHSWLFRESKTQVSTKSGQRYITLPEDFGEHIHTTVPGGTIFGIQYADKRFIQDLYQSPNVLTGASSRVWLAYYREVEREGGTEKVADMYPEPSGDQAITFDILYMKSWIDLYGTADGKEIPNIPRSHERALLLLCRAFAQHEIDQSQAIEDPAYQAEIQRLIKKDGLSSMSKGEIRGGAMSLYPEGGEMFVQSANLVN